MHGLDLSADLAEQHRFMLSASIRGRRRKDFDRQKFQRMFPRLTCQLRAIEYF
jgi:hypothetical protein